MEPEAIRKAAETVADAGNTVTTSTVIFGLTFGELIALLLAIGAIVNGVAKLLNDRASNVIRDQRANMDLRKEQKDKAETERDEAYKQIADSTVKLQNALVDNKQALDEITILQDKISELENNMAERPSLISWGPTMYREAFPDNPDDHRTHKFYCAACWNVKRLVVPIEKYNGSTLTCKNWREDWHMNHRSDLRL